MFFQLLSDMMYWIVLQHSLRYAPSSILDGTALLELYLCYVTAFDAVSDCITLNYIIAYHIIPFDAFMTVLLFYLSRNKEGLILRYTVGSLSCAAFLFEIAAHPLLSLLSLISNHHSLIVTAIDLHTSVSFCFRIFYFILLVVRGAPSLNAKNSFAP